MDERTKKLIDTYKTQGPLSQGAIADVFATTPPNRPITSASLSNTEAPINIPSPAPSTTAAGISGSTTALLEQDKERQSQLEKQQATALEQQKIEAPKQSAYDKLLASVGLQRQGQQERLSDVEAQQRGIVSEIGTTKKDIATRGRAEFGLDTLEPTRRKALQDLRTSQVRELAELKALETANMTDAGRLAAQKEIQRKYGMEQLEAQLSYHLANDDITAAEKTINDRISLETEPLYAQLDLTKNVYNQISNSLSKTENREWELAISGINQRIEDTKELEKTRGDIVITSAKNGTPLPSYVVSEINRASSFGELYQVLAKNGVSLAEPSKSGTGGVASASVEYYSQLLAEGKINLSNVPQNIRNAVVAFSQGVINKPLSDTALSKINDTNFAISSLNDLRAKIQTNLGQLGPITGLQALNPYSEKRKLLADIDRVRQTVGKALEGGVLRKEDEEKYKKILATITDTPETALYKIDALISSIQRNIEDYKSLQSESGRFVPTKTGTIAPEDLRAKYNY